MDKTQILQFIAEQKTAFIGSVNEQGYPVIRAMLAPRKIDGSEIYFTTNTSSNKIKQYLANNKACIYFYQRGKFKYQGASIIGEMEVCTDQATKNEIWRFGDKMFYKQGVTDPDYCVLKFKGVTAEYYCDFKTQTIELLIFREEHAGAPIQACPRAIKTWRGGQLCPPRYLLFLQIS